MYDGCSVAVQTAIAVFGHSRNDLEYGKLLVLAVHIVFAIVCLPLLYYVLLLAYGYDRRELSETPHPRVGRIAATLWAVSFTLGLVVYAALYVVPW